MPEDERESEQGGRIAEEVRAHVAEQAPDLGEELKVDSTVLMDALDIRLFRSGLATELITSALREGRGAGADHFVELAVGSGANEVQVSFDARSVYAEGRIGLSFASRFTREPPITMNISHREPPVV